ncbi:MAG: hypothetical protein WCA77_03255 [Thermoplasmata archaeon]
MYDNGSFLCVGRLAVARALVGSGLSLALLTALGTAAASQTPLQKTEALIWVITAISVAGALITFGFMVYALWRFRDPRTRGRRYG